MRRRPGRPGRGVGLGVRPRVHGRRRRVRDARTIGGAAVRRAAATWSGSRSGAERLGLDVPLSERALRDVVDDVVGAAGRSAEARLRITLTGGAGAARVGPRRRAADPRRDRRTARRLGGRDDGGHGAVAAQRALGARRRQDRRRSPRTCTALAEARKVDAAEAILPNTRGRPVRGHRHQRVRGRRRAGCHARRCVGLPARGDPGARPRGACPRPTRRTSRSARSAGRTRCCSRRTTRDVQPLRMLDGRPLPGSRAGRPAGRRPRWPTSRPATSTPDGARGAAGDASTVTPGGGGPRRRPPACGGRPRRSRPPGGPRR